MQLTYKAIELELVTHVQNHIELWVGCPYVAGGSSPIYGADCLRSAGKLIGSIYGKSINIEDLPQDLGMNDRVKATRAMRKIRRSFMPNSIVRNYELNAGDVLVTAWINGGPGHVMICGDNALYHCPRQFGKFCKTGFIIPEGQELSRIYRYDNREEWLQS